MGVLGEGLAYGALGEVGVYEAWAEYLPGGARGQGVADGSFCQVRVHPLGGGERGRRTGHRGGICRVPVPGLI